MEQDQHFSSLFIIDHPMIQHKLTIMRDKTTDTITFRALLKEIALLMGFEITRDFPTTLTDVETPLTKAKLPVIAGKKVAVVPILRAGLGMAEGLLELIPTARVGHIGLYRDPTTKMPVEYLVKLPDPRGRMFILVDPMLATGHSAAHAMDVLNKRGIKDNNILFMTLVSCPEGVQVVQEAHPKVKIYTAALDSHLNDKAYIIPGLGDAGDRLFGTR